MSFKNPYTQSSRIINVCSYFTSKSALLPLPYMTDTTHRGFVIQTSFRIEQDKPILYIHGRLETGESFVVRETRHIPHFYLRTEDIGHKAVKKCKIRKSEKLTLDGHPTARVEFPKPTPFLASVRDRLQFENVPTYEADLRFSMTYLIQNNIRGGIAITGELREDDPLVDFSFEDPEVESAEVDFELRVLAINIETDPTAIELLAVSLYGLGLDEVMIVDQLGREMPDHATGYPNAKSLLQALEEKIREVDPDVITGWNVVEFDLDVLARVAKRNRLRLQLGRSSSEVRIHKTSNFFVASRAVVHGRMVLDGISLIHGASMKFPKYSLDEVAQTVLGKGKPGIERVSERAEEIYRRYLDDLEGFALYARTDTQLAYEIVEKLNLIPLAVRRCKLTGMPLDRVASSITSFDFLYLSQLQKRNLVAPSIQTQRAPRRIKHSGALILDPTPGLHENIWVLDYRSLYPSIIRTFNIDPLTQVKTTPTNKHIKTTNGVHYERERGILPRILDELFEARKEADERQDGTESYAIKILMNSLYGVLATPNCRFHDTALANSITSLGRHFLRFVQGWFELNGHQVIYGDTDSVFVKSNVEDKVEAYELGKSIQKKYNSALTAYITRRWNLRNKLTLNFEHLYTKLFLPKMRSRKSGAGARKRYVGLDYVSGEIEFVGIESVRRDWTEVAKRVQKELFKRLFRGEPIEEYLRQYIKEFRSGKFDHQLIYRKRLGKPLKQYQRAPSPYVVAARKMKNPGRHVEYVMTIGGAEPLECLRHSPDREHYVYKQIAPAVKPILDALDMDFEHIAEESTPLDIFQSIRESEPEADAA